MKNSSRKGVSCIAGVGIVLLGLAFFAPEPKSSRPFVIGVGVWPGMETLTLARENNVFPTSDVNFVGMAWPSAAMTAFKNNAVDGVIVTLDEVIRLQAGGHHPKAVLVLGRSNGSDAIVSRPEFNSLEELRGKRVGVELQTSGEYMLAQALRSVGMDSSDVVRVPINLAETESAFEFGELDAVVTADPWLMKLSEKGARVLFDSSKLPAAMTRVLVVREDLLNNPSKGLQMAVDSHFQYLSMLYLAESNQRGMAAVLRRETLDQSQFKNALNRITRFSREKNRILLSSGTDGVEPMLKEVASFMKWEGLLENEEGIKSILDARLVKGGD